MGHGRGRQHHRGVTQSLEPILQLRVRQPAIEVCINTLGRKSEAPSDTAVLSPHGNHITTAPAPTEVADGSGSADKPLGRLNSVHQGHYCNLFGVKFDIILSVAVGTIFGLLSD
ncbi:uncharacterized protein CTRU02_214167 [Colletotrichum truncatum]|uniref:Uncharacterized protein n=1 Tax=Colletotrichum truncatum TaxID=5467 RepID=A0ACC3YHR0_COLTU|nr:uncharacterized protein CTRU02_11247 [Colletotrichum truncatum]KAF6785989.1 hypothetical protein CTRU02_11247 [Colletotrichum truncatum]